MRIFFSLLIFVIGMITNVNAQSSEMDTTSSNVSTEMEYQIGMIAKATTMNGNEHYNMMPGGRVLGKIHVHDATFYASWGLVPNISQSNLQFLASELEVGIIHPLNELLSFSGGVNSTWNKKVLSKASGLKDPTYDNNLHKRFSSICMGIRITPNNRLIIVPKFYFGQYKQFETILAYRLF